MAVPFTKQRRDEISEKLKEGARISAAEKGMKKTSVDGLVAYAQISKGAFYNFYESKDELFLDIVEDWHTEIYGEILDMLFENNGLSDKKKTALAIFKACEMIKENGYLNFIHRDLDMLLDNLKETEFIDRFHSDDIHIAEVIRFSGIKLIVTDDEAVSIIKNLVFTVLNSEMKGYWQAQKILINSVCNYIIK